MRPRWSAALLAAALALPGCIQDDGTRFNPWKQLTEVSEDQERDLGAQFDREVEKFVRIIDDPVVVGFVNDLGQEIVRRIEPQPFIYRFRVVADPQLNAFAVPGGYIYLHSGTILAAGSLDELAGVVAHEIAHVKGRHFARLQEKTAIPNLIAAAAAVAAAAAAREPGAAVAAQAANVAVQLRFTREFEVEADQLGMNFMSRSGFDPRGMARFFERIVAEEQSLPFAIPPYLYSHPDVKDRIAAVEDRAGELRPQLSPDPALAGQLRAVQARLAWMARLDRSRFSEPARPVDRARSAPLLARAETLVAGGERDAALALLSGADAAESHDPRLSFRAAELYDEAGRHEEAIAAYRRTLELDPTRALVLYRLGLAYKAKGDRHRATYYLEQAMRRFGDRGDLRRKAEWEVQKLTFRVIEAAGTADGSEARGADSVAGFSREAFRGTDARVVWWGRLNPRFVVHDDKLSVRWIDPDGAVRQEEPARRLRRPFVTSSFALRGETPLQPGRWQVEARLEDDVVDTRSFELRID